MTNRQRETDTMSEISEEASEEVERVLPEAPHWNGVGKYGPALCMDKCTVHIMSRGFGAKDGDAYLTHDPTECDWERDEDGKDYVVVPLTNSDLLFLRDQLNALFPDAPLQSEPQEPTDSTSPDQTSEITEEMIYIAFTEGRYGTHISKWAHTPFEGCIAYTRAASPDQTNGLLAGLTRPIIGIGNRAAQEVFDIMVDRIRAALASTPTARIEESEPEIEPVAWRWSYTLD